MQCKAHSSRTGKRCRRHAIRGGAVCYVHGGAAPHVRRKANERLLFMADPAIERLAQLLRFGSESDSVRAANDILDRADLKDLGKN